MVLFWCDSRIVRTLIDHGITPDIVIAVNLKGDTVHVRYEKNINLNSQTL